MSQYFDSFFSIGGFIYYRESNIPNFWDRFNVLEHGSTDSLTSVFKPGAYLGKKKSLNNNTIIVKYQFSRISLLS